MPLCVRTIRKVATFRCSFVFDLNRIVHKILFYDILWKSDYRETTIRIISTVYKCHKITIIYVWSRDRETEYKQECSASTPSTRRIEAIQILFSCFLIKLDFYYIIYKNKKNSTKGLIKSISIFNKNHYMFYAKGAFSVRSLYLPLYAMLVQILYLFRLLPSPVPRQPATTANRENKSMGVSRCGIAAYFHIIMRPGSPFHYMYTSEMACKRIFTFQGSMIGLSEGDLIFTQLSFSSSPFTSDILLAFHCRDVFMAIITYSCKLVFFLFCSIALQLFYGL